MLIGWLLVGWPLKVILSAVENRKQQCSRRFMSRSPVLCLSFNYKMYFEAEIKFPNNSDRLPLLNFMPNL